MASRGAVTDECCSRPIEVRSWWDGAVRLMEVGEWADPRGCLVDFDFRAMPFEPRRSFVVRDVPAGTLRGGHAHVRAQQLLVCLAGTVAVELRHAGERHQVELCNAAHALLVTAGVWARQRYSGPDAVLMVMASEPYDADAYLSEPA
jgi:dTDP-4-dehydrorhamnose 3,5-epimerase-like enzyme